MQQQRVVVRRWKPRTKAGASILLLLSGAPPGEARQTGFSVSAAAPPHNRDQSPSRSETITSLFHAEDGAAGPRSRRRLSPAAAGLRGRKCRRRPRPPSRVTTGRATGSTAQSQRLIVHLNLQLDQMTPGARNTN